jgi:hypothetical protein
LVRGLAAGDVDVNFDKMIFRRAVPLKLLVRIYCAAQPKAIFALCTHPNDVNAVVLSAEWNHWGLLVESCTPASRLHMRG